METKLVLKIIILIHKEKEIIIIIEVIIIIIEEEGQDIVGDIDIEKVILKEKENKT